MPDESRVPLNALIAIVISAVRLIKLIPAAVNARERERGTTFVRRGAHRGIIRRACVTKTLSRPLNDLDKCRVRAARLKLDACRHLSCRRGSRPNRAETISRAITRTLPRDALEKRLPSFAFSRRQLHCISHATLPLPLSLLLLLLSRGIPRRERRRGKSPRATVAMMKSHFSSVTRDAVNATTTANFGRVPSSSPR